MWIFKPDLWLAGSCIPSQTEARFEKFNSSDMKFNFRIYLCNIGPW